MSKSNETHQHEEAGHEMPSSAGHSMMPPAVQLMAGSPIQRQSCSDAQPIGNVLGYIAGEMSTNWNSGHVTTIRAERFLPRGQMLAYAHWAALVRPGGVWDHKPHIQSTYGTWAHDAETATDFMYDIWSNVHYGYIGIRCGFTPTELLQGAGAAQFMAGTQESEEEAEQNRENGSSGLAAYDDPADQRAILIGIALAGSVGAGVTANDLLTAVRNSASSLTTQDCS